MKYYGKELYHHGVQGMKWGVRHYQNKDGSLTPAGEKHYYKNGGRTVLSERQHYKSGKKKSIIGKRERKAFKIVKDEAIVPELKKAAVIAGVTALGAAVAYASLNPKIRSTTYNLVKKVARSKTDSIARFTDNGINFVQRIVKSRPAQTAIKVAGAVETGRTAYKVHKRFQNEGVYKDYNIRFKRRKKKTTR